MRKIHRLATAVSLSLLAGTTSFGASAQSTDGYHSIQVFPVVVDSAAFTQRFTFRNPDKADAVTITPTYVPGDGSSQTAAITCPDIVVAAAASATRASVRDLCPALATGSQYGFLYMAEASAANRPFAAFSRVSNPQGNGFSVEAFPAHTFTSADSVVAGVRRIAATANSPAFQTNCFIGNLNEVTPGAVTFPSIVEYIILDSAGTELGRSNVTLTPGKLTRLLDVFGSAGLPAGNVNDASVRFEEIGSGEPGLLTFCTVQDNTSFGADFRIAKQEEGFSTPYSSIGAQDDHVTRDATVESDIAGDAGTERPFVIVAGAFANTHVMYFRHPDRVQCELIDPATGLQAVPGYGLEMRLLAQDGLEVVAGGDAATGFGEVYLGDKGDRNDGANTRYLLQVESSGGPNAVNARPYRLHCQSGSGHTLGDLVRYNTAGTTF